MAMHETTSNNNKDTSVTEKNIIRHTSPFVKDDDDDSDSSITNRALVILNSPISKPPSKLFEFLWSCSKFKVCADGGANRLWDATKDHNADSYVPDLIKGDLDSLLPDVRDHYKSRGTRIERDPCQDTNDLDKALQSIIQQHETKQQVFVYGAFGGRFDQEMASIQALYNWSNKFDGLSLYDDSTCAFLLPPNTKNEIRMPFYDEETKAEIGEGPTCGLIPIGCKCDFVKTSSLKWDLDGSIPTEFGGLVSTSNRIMSPVVMVECSQPLVFTAEVNAG